MSNDKPPRVVVTSGRGGNLGMMLAVLILVIGIVAAVWFFNESQAGEETTDITIDLETESVDPGTETTITP